MSKKSMRFVFVLVTVLTLARVTNGQLNEKKFEAGAVFTSITLSDFTAFTSPANPIQDNTIRGLGGRFAYNLNDNFAIDAEAEFFLKRFLERRGWAEATGICRGEGWC